MSSPFKKFNKMFQQSIAEADEFYADLQSEIKEEDARNVQRQAFAGMLWSKQFYYFDVRRWLTGDSGSPHRLTNGWMDAIMNGFIFTTQTLFPCLINGNSPGMPHGIWHFIVCHWCWLIRNLPKGSFYYSPANGTCIPTDNCQPTNGPLAM
ncbi:hypothetical protein [Candidatus Kuenenia stuttgartiensis]|uniref:hypothetical protein n=1 Tax=Kuenenia stuttgartiensis TaxID=174633 RepID=UPI00146EE93C|nr:hypothetical protein [Candidatus Kuenenia stuttgartiensis]